MKTTCLHCGNLYDSDAVPHHADACPACPACALAAFVMGVEKRLIKLEDATTRLAKAIEKHVELDVAENRYNRLKRMEKRLQEAEDWITDRMLAEHGFFDTDEPATERGI